MKQTLTTDEARQLNPLNLAFIGDTVREAYIRDQIFPKLKNHTASVLHQTCVRFVRAEAQSDAMEGIMEQLTDAEVTMFKRGRNQKSAHVPKNAVLADYRRATGFEALLGYLYLTDQHERLDQVMDMAFQAIQPTEESVADQKK